MSDFKQETSSFNAFIPKKWQDTGWSQGDLSNTLLRSARPGLKEPGLKDGVAALGLRGDELKTKPATLADTQSIPAAQDDRSPRAKEDAPAVTQARPPEPPQAAQPIIVNPAIKSSTPAFAPVLAAGALSALMKDRAAAPDSTAKKMDNNPSKAFQYGMVEDGSEAARARRYHNTTDELIHQYDAADSNNDFYYQYMMQQQFMQSQEYAMALEITNRELEELYQKREELRGEIDRLRERYQQANEKVEQAEANVAEKEERATDLQDLKDKKEAHESNARAYYEAEDEYRKYQDKIEAMPSVNTVVRNNNVYLVSEDGMSYYKVDKDGNAVKVDETKEFPDCPIPSRTFMRKAADGSIEYVNDKGDVMGKEQTEQMNAYLKAQGKKPEDVMANYDEYKAAMEDPARVAAEEKLTKVLDNAADSEKELWKQAHKLNIPIDKLDAIDDYMKANQKDLQDARAELDKAKAERSLTAEQLAEKEAELKEMEKTIKQTEDFKQKLAAGSFKNEAEMVAAMPAGMKMKYEMCMSGKEPSATASQECLRPAMSADPAPADATSRANGSAAPPAINSSANVSGDFAAASQSTAPANANSPAPEQAPEKKVAATAPVAAPAP